MRTLAVTEKARLRTQDWKKIPGWVHISVHVGGWEHGVVWRGRIGFPQAQEGGLTSGT